jgi:hypothetical protein
MLSSSCARTSLSVRPRRSDLIPSKRPCEVDAPPRRGRDGRASLAASFPVVDLVGQRGAVGEERHPGAKRRRAHRVVDERGNALLDVLPFEREDHEIAAEIERVSREAEVRWIERRARCDQFARLLLRPFPQPQGDDQPLHWTPLSGFPSGVAPSAIEPILGFTATSISLFEASSNLDESSRVAAKVLQDENPQRVMPNPPKITSGKLMAHKLPEFVGV